MFLAGQAVMRIETLSALAAREALSAIIARGAFAGGVELAQESRGARLDAILSAGLDASSIRRVAGELRAMPGVQAVRLAPASEIGA